MVSWCTSTSPSIPVIHRDGRPGVLNADVTHRYQYICADNEERWLEPFRRTIALRYGLAAELRRNHGAYDLARCAKYLMAFTRGRLRGQTALLDDPFAIFSTAWFSQQLGCRCVVLVRDPIAVVGSWRKLGWSVQLNDVLQQRLLVRDHLGSYEERMRTLVDSPDWLARSSLLWEMAYATVQSRFQGLPNVVVVRYEDLAADPRRGFESLYASVGLPWSPSVDDVVRTATAGTSAHARGSHAWTLRGGPSRTAFRPMDSRSAVVVASQRLDPQQAARVRELTVTVAATFGYGEQSLRKTRMEHLDVTEASS